MNNEIIDYVIDDKIFENKVSNKLTFQQKLKSLIEKNDIIEIKRMLFNAECNDIMTFAITNPNCFIPYIENDTILKWIEVKNCHVCMYHETNYTYVKLRNIAFKNEQSKEQYLNCYNKCISEVKKF